MTSGGLIHIRGTNGSEEAAWSNSFRVLLSKQLG